MDQLNDNMYVALDAKPKYSCAFYLNKSENSNSNHRILHS